SSKTIRRRLRHWLLLDGFHTAWAQLAQRYVRLHGVNGDQVLRVPQRYVIFSAQDNRLPSGAKTTSYFAASSFSIRFRSPASASQRVTDRPPTPASNLPSEEKATERRACSDFSADFSVRNPPADRTSQIRTSALAPSAPVATFRPSGA